MSSLVVITPLHPSKLEYFEDNKQVHVSEDSKANDSLDTFNHPRLRRAIILSTLAGREGDITYFVPSEPLNVEEWTQLYRSVHSEGLINFLSTAWSTWSSYRQGRDDMPLIWLNSPLLRDPNPPRPSKSPVGLMGYYCTDKDTPVFSDLLDEMLMDGKLIQHAVDMVSTEDPKKTVYTLVTHPGHHSTHDCFGGYCYTNHVATMARLLQSTKPTVQKVAILDVDYHVGNGTASIFYKDPSVLVVSIHCDPDYDYPFHSGFADETGDGLGLGTTLHIPLPPGTTWTKEYRPALERACEKIRQFGPQAVIVSLGLDTYDQDPVCVLRAGFHLQQDDYLSMGTTIAENIPVDVPVIFLQEGGYRMEKIGTAAANVVTSFCKARPVE